jgi:hypothetical protein
MGEVHIVMLVPDVMAPPLFNALKRSAFGAVLLGAAVAAAVVVVAVGCTTRGAAVWRVLELNWVAS